MNEFKIAYKNTLLTLNLFFIFLHFLFPTTFSFYFPGTKHTLSLYFSVNFFTFMLIDFIHYIYFTLITEQCQSNT